MQKIHILIHQIINVKQIQQVVYNRLIQVVKNVLMVIINLNIIVQNIVVKKVIIWIQIILLHVLNLQIQIVNMQHILHQHKHVQNVKMVMY